MDEVLNTEMLTEFGRAERRDFANINDGDVLSQDDKYKLAGINGKLIGEPELIDEDNGARKFRARSFDKKTGEEKVVEMWINEPDAPKFKDDAFNELSWIVRQEAEAFGLDFETSGQSSSTYIKQPNGPDLRFSNHAPTSSAKSVADWAIDFNDYVRNDYVTYEDAAHELGLKFEKAGPDDDDDEVNDRNEEILQSELKKQGYNWNESEQRYDKVSVDTRGFIKKLREILSKVDKTKQEE